MERKINLKKEREKYFVIGYLTFFLMFILFLIIVFAIFSVQGQGLQKLEFNEGDNYTLIQNCGLCTFVNISSVINDKGLIIIENVGMVNKGTFFIYDLEDDIPRGIYIVNTFGDSMINGNITTSSYFLIINPDDDNLFYFDKGNTFNIVVLLVAFGIAIILYFLNLPLYSGLIVIVSGFLLLFNDFNIPLSMIIVGMGVVVLFVVKK